MQRIAKVTKISGLLQTFGLKLIQENVLKVKWLMVKLDEKKNPQVSYTCLLHADLFQLLGINGMTLQSCAMWCILQE